MSRRRLPVPVEEESGTGNLEVMEVAATLGELDGGLLSLKESWQCGKLDILM